MFLKHCSRFGKFVQIQFDNKGKISGAAVKTYLLERSRVCQITSPERSYHAFYFLCAGPDEVSKIHKKIYFPFLPNQKFQLYQGLGKFYNYFYYFLGSYVRYWNRKVYYYVGRISKGINSDILVSSIISISLHVFKWIGWMMPKNILIPKELWMLLEWRKKNRFVLIFWFKNILFDFIKKIMVLF